MRKKIEKLEVKEFIENQEYHKKQIWDLVYISTSCEEDNDSDDSSDEEDEEEEVKSSPDKEEKPLKRDIPDYVAKKD